jgi:hypothetical protein
MPKIIIDADVRDGVEWEELFRTRSDLFRKQTITEVSYAVNGNHVTCCFDAEDLDTYMEILDSEATAEAMIADGVDRNTVSVRVLDHSFRP